LEDALLLPIGVDEAEIVLLHARNVGSQHEGHVEAAARGARRTVRAARTPRARGHTAAAIPRAGTTGAGSAGARRCPAHATRGPGTSRGRAPGTRATRRRGNGRASGPRRSPDGRA